jgi:heparanase 1
MRSRDFHLVALVAAFAGCMAVPLLAEPIAVNHLRPIAKVDDRFQSYNVEMAEVIGGRFWAPYPKPGEASVPATSLADLAAKTFRKRDPANLRNNTRLQHLAAALGPAYIRVGGGWANSAYFQDDDAPAPATPPKGFQGVLTRAQWAGVVAFSKATNARIVTSFPVSAGARDASGAWSPDQARSLIRYTRSIGGSIYAAEVINEPNVGAIGGSLPRGYDGAAFARDADIFTRFLRKEAPDIRTIGPVSTGEAGYQLFPKVPGSISTEALLSAEPRAKFDIFAYHFYGAASQRCKMLGKDVSVGADQALSEAWLDRADKAYDYYKALHDRFEPGTPIWITEEGEAGCGGDPWAATFLDTFRYIDQLARMAKRNVAAVFHNTLAASDYALIDDETLTPRPSYWAALLWRRLMGRTVLDAGALQPGLHVYAQCLRDRSGGVALLAINLDRTKPASLDIPIGAERYSLTADDLQSGVVRLNGRTLALTGSGNPPKLAPIVSGGGAMALAPASITFLAMPKARNAACAAQ